MEWLRMLDSDLGVAVVFGCGIGLIILCIYIISLIDKLRKRRKIDETLVG